MISPVFIGYIGVVAMLALAFSGIPIAYCMCLIGTLGLAYTSGFEAAATQNILVAWEQGSSFSLMTIPLFIFMGTIAYHTRIVADLFDCIRKWVGHIPGGLAIAGVIASAAFGAVTGSTAASAATMGSTVMPELTRHNYNASISAGSLAASAGLAAVIPPSVFIIIFCVLTEQSIGRIFIATIGPGLLLTALFCVYLLIRCRITPSLGPSVEKSCWHDRLVSLKSSIPIVVVFGIVIGGLFAGIVTPTEASALGVAGVMIIALCIRRLTKKALWTAFTEGTRLTTSIFLLVIGGWLISRFMVVTGTTQHLVRVFVDMNMSYLALVAWMFLLFLILGCCLEATSILILTMPFLFPITQSYGISPDWFGVFVTMMMVLAGITPPMGLNVFILHGVCPSISITDTFKGAFPYFFLIFICLIIMTIFPQCVLWLPNAMM